jgi:hypothetical protein
MPVKEFKVRSSEDEKVRRILNRFSEVTIIGEEEEVELEPKTRTISFDTTKSEKKEASPKNF